MHVALLVCENLHWGVFNAGIYYVLALNRLDNFYVHNLAYKLGLTSSVKYGWSIRVIDALHEDASRLANVCSYSRNVIARSIITSGFTSCRTSSDQWSATLPVSLGRTPPFRENTSGHT